MTRLCHDNDTEDDVDDEEERGDTEEQHVDNEERDDDMDGQPDDHLSRTSPRQDAEGRLVASCSPQTRTDPRSELGARCVLPGRPRRPPTHCERQVQRCSCPLVVA